MKLVNKRFRLLFSIGVLLIFIAGILVFIMGHNQPKAEIRFEAEPQSDIYVDGKLIGVTPKNYETNVMKPTVLLIPHDRHGEYLPYETALSLTPQTKTIVRRNFNIPIANSTTQILSFVKNNENGAPLTIITNPESAYIFINNEYVGTSPLRIVKPVGTYSVQVMFTGYQAINVSLKNSDGYNLVAYLDLANQPLHTVPTQVAPVAEGNQSPTVTILKTPTGYLRVHESPTPSGAEIARALVGREYPFKEYSPLKNWIEINLNASQSGWILSQYATVSGVIQ